ncbi:hypothetical protein Mmc1_2851 [Magnetococcus marinus MC-1]|uniref:Uncharacterized protein n=1 Tax=Magnetococcus marinus (strain ATCC BAA-1437 / JCM 17883 / MC-1) TaxID=156889 RepID=A0LBK1_MAGMM|nr:hypothetical protein [Magnetococcus marinus]ABK45344.1 hypothetical protein Mmc1_2851 [Magnetococcus marinus MC-1]
MKMLMLESGWSVDRPSDALLLEVAKLEEMGVITSDLYTYVLCSNPEDRDYPPPNHLCSGRVRLVDSLDEGADDYRCPECNHPVYPEYDEKQTFQELCYRVDQEGALSFLQEEIEAIGSMRALTDGVYRCDHADGEVIICVVEVCEHPKYLSRDYVASTPTVVVALHDRNAELRLLEDPWLIKTSLSQLIRGDQDLASLMRDALHAQPPVLTHTSVPIYNKVITPLYHHQAEQVEPEVVYQVQYRPDEIRVNGQMVVGLKAAAQIRVFEILWKQFLKGMLEGKLVDDFKIMTLEKITDAVQLKVPEEVVDAVIVRRSINRLRNMMMDAVKKQQGLPIQQDSIIENIKTARGAQGYRINPLLVLPRASQTS